MGTILEVYLVFPIILWVAKKVHSANFKFRIIIFVAILPLYYLTSKYQNVMADKVIYFVMGIYFALDYEFIKKMLLKYKSFVIVVFFLLFIYAYLDEIKVIEFQRILYILYTLFSILALYIATVYFQCKNKLYKSLKFIGKYSYVAYMAHIMMINYILV